MCKGAFSNVLEEMSMYFGKNTETDVKVKNYAVQIVFNI